MSSKTKEKSSNYQELYEELKSGLYADIEQFLLDANRKLINSALEQEVCDFLGRERYSRIDKDDCGSIRSYRNGFQERTIRTKSGKIKIKKPRLRDRVQEYRSEILARLDELESKLYKTIIEGYVRGLSTRDIEKTFTDQDGKPLISRSGVSEITKELYGEYERFSSKDLSELDIVYLFADGVYESVKRYTNNLSMLCAWGITSKGEKVMLSLSVADKESTASWVDFFNDMKNRGLRHPLLVISDGSRALISAITQCFPKSERQRCLAHKLRNLGNKLPENVHKELLNQVRAVYYAPNKETATDLSKNLIDKYTNEYPSFIKCFIDDFDACITHLGYPLGHHKFIRTTNLIERTFAEQKRRTKVIPEHQNEKSAIKLVSAVLLRVAEDWNKITISDFDLTLLRNIKKIRNFNNNDNQNDKISMIA